MSLSSGAPGSIRFWIPSIPAMSIAEKARYGLHEGSGGRNSNRFNFGFVEHIGIRMAAERLRPEEARLTGASKPGTRRLELVGVGHANATIDGACLSHPPTERKRTSH